MGFSGASGLKMDDNGVWHGRAMKDGRTVDVSVDYQEMSSRADPKTSF